MTAPDPSEADVRAARDVATSLRFPVPFEKPNITRDYNTRLIAAALASARAEGEAAGLERAAKWLDERPTLRCGACGYEGRVIRRSACCGDQCPKCWDDAIDRLPANGESLLAALRALTPEGKR